MFTSGYKISRRAINTNLIQDCRSILPLILSNPKYIETGVTFYSLFKNKPDRFPDVKLKDMSKIDLFIISNPCNDYPEIKKTATL